jgi:hypothetical protein
VEQWSAAADWAQIARRDERVSRKNIYIDAGWRNNRLHIELRIKVLHFILSFFHSFILSFFHSIAHRVKDKSSAFQFFHYTLDAGWSSGPPRRIGLRSPDETKESHGKTFTLTRGGAVAARRAHNPKVVGSIPTPATIFRNVKPKNEDKNPKKDDSTT